MNRLGSVCSYIISNSPAAASFSVYNGNRHISKKIQNQNLFKWWNGCSLFFFSFFSFPLVPVWSLIFLFPFSVFHVVNTPTEIFLLNDIKFPNLIGIDTLDFCKLSALEQ